MTPLYFKAAKKMVQFLLSDFSILTFEVRTNEKNIGD